ncbi:Zinc finger MYND-type [Penicillium brevicompactum]|uniref:Zinc finger MYND-type n=1 Tax=Penicillium brevicompactum TaxID=5074 RepID=UPI0025402FFB|nr:Zinc finger MYND-type [Penicillium brevicompactum]KAJ5336579.1 Zinc finger MYND-type [Penicillium brevicompactum]
MTTAMQLRHFNRLQRPETDVGGLPNHWHFEIRPMPGYKGELVFIVNPHGRYFHGEGRTQISNLSIKDQAKVIVPLLLEALSPNSMACPPPVAENKSSFAPYSWSTKDPLLARVVSARCRTVGIRSELCTVQVSDAQTVQIAGECWKKWKNDILHAMSMYDCCLTDDGEEKVEMEGGCEYCHFTPSFDRPLFPCTECDAAYYCSKECKSLRQIDHNVTCVGGLDQSVSP